MSGGFRRSAYGGFVFLRRGLVTAINVLLTQNVVFVVICNLLIDRLYIKKKWLNTIISLFFFFISKGRDRMDPILHSRHHQTLAHIKIVMHGRVGQRGP